MKLVKFVVGNRTSLGALLGDGGEIIDLTRIFEDRRMAPPSIADLLAGDGFNLAREVVAEISANAESARSRGLLISSTAVRLRPPAADRPFVVCAGANYRAHIEEMKDKPPPTPMAFIKAPSAVIATDEPISLPRDQGSMVDFEGELCVVFGRRCANATVDNAASFIGGYTILNDVSARDWVPKMRDPEISPLISVGVMLMGKQFPGFCPLGPCILTADEAGGLKTFHITTTLNGKVMQDARTDDLYFDIPTLIAAYSRYYTFEPGDIMSTGSPPGVGMGRKPPLFMKPGDEVCVTVDGIGTLRNRVVAG
jgi:2-keto-4-pentenoate hydratase/2-oxohepta-3-ene-1,7-dioic acid hydratase in catechol pathway